MMLIFLLLLILLWTIHFRYKRRRLYELASKIPTIPGGNPVFGHVHQFVGDTEHIMSLLKKYNSVSIELGGISKLWLNHLLFTVISEPVSLEKVVKTCLEKDDLHRFIRNFLGNGIIFAPVQFWKVRRKIVVPALSAKIVQSFIYIFADNSIILADKLEASSSTGELSVWPYVNRYALDSICETALGIKLHAQNEPNVPFLVALNQAEALVSERMFQIWYQPDWLYKLFRSKYKKHEKCRQIMINFVDEMIARKISVHKSKSSQNFSTYAESKHQAMLDIILNVLGEKKTDNKVLIREEILSLIIAGTDTTAVAICNTLMLLAKYPEIQERVHQELLSVFNDSVRPMVEEDLSKLHYLERVMKESMRLFPPVPILARKILKETTLPSGYVLPAGSGAIINIWGAHLDPKYWGPDAESFDPDRFLPERFNRSHPCPYIPFSGGPRICLGYQYATMSMKAALSSILRRFTVVGKPEDGPIPHMKMKMDLMMKEVNGYRIALVKKRFS